MVALKENKVVKEFKEYMGAREGALRKAEVARQRVEYKQYAAEKASERSGDSLAVKDFLGDDAEHNTDRVVLASAAEADDRAKNYFKEEKRNIIRTIPDKTLEELVFNIEVPEELSRKGRKVNEFVKKIQEIESIVHNYDNKTKDRNGNLIVSEEVVRGRAVKYVVERITENYLKGKDGKGPAYVSKEIAEGVAEAIASMVASDTRLSRKVLGNMKESYKEKFEKELASTRERVEYVKENLMALPEEKAMQYTAMALGSNN